MTPLNDSGFLQQYLELNTKLARTLVIKSSISADMVNEGLITSYGSEAVDQHDPTSWKYYLNLSGEYHARDTEMTVTSLDTLETIAFTKENLKIHLATADAYQFGTRYYYSLVNRYPEQESLIFGVRYPVEIQAAIQAKDGSILGYPQELVEPQEQTLMLELEDFIVHYLRRWEIPAFGVSDTLYNAASHALLYLAVLPKLINLRLKRCHTQETHSFHIRQFLASHGGLDRYLPYLTLEQALWLYRNVRYLRLNVGKSETLWTLVENLLTKRGIPIAEYSVRHLNELDESHYPLIRARQKPLNKAVNTAETSYRDVTELMKLQNPLNSGNELYHSQHTGSMLKAFMNSTSSVAQTKVLQSEMVDYTDATQDPLPVVKLREWISVASEGLYDVVINFKDPKSSENRSLKALDAYIYMQYLTFSRLGVYPEYIPDMYVSKRRKLSLPTVNQLLSVVQPSVRESLREFAAQTLLYQPKIGKFTSIAVFRDYTRALYEQGLTQLKALGGMSDIDRYAGARNILYSLYEDKRIKLFTSPVRYVDWLLQKNLPEYDYTDLQAQEVIGSIFDVATGTVDDPTLKLANIQRAMTDAMRELCSYTVQIIATINDASIRPLHSPAVSLGNFVSSASKTANAVTQVDTVSASVVWSDKEDLSVETIGVQSFKAPTLGVGVDASIPVQVTVVDKRDFIYRLDNGSNYYNASYIGRDQEISARAGYVGKEYYLALTDAQKLDLASIYP